MPITPDTKDWTWVMERPCPDCGFDLLADDYASQDPVDVAVALIEAAGTVAGTCAGVTPEQTGRPGLRSNGDRFTVATLGSHHLHDVGALDA